MDLRDQKVTLVRTDFLAHQVYRGFQGLVAKDLLAHQDFLDPPALQVHQG